MWLAGSIQADPLSKRNDIDFFREVPSRNLHGLAARSDGRLVAGPSLTELSGTAPADLLWCLAATNDPAKWLVGTGPDGRIFEVTLDTAKASYTTREVAHLGEPHVFALLRLPDGAILAGTSPKGALCLVRDGKEVARATLPVDSIFALLAFDAKTVLAATGNPGRIYQIDVAKFAAAGVGAEKLTDAKALAAHGIALFGEIRDRNVRCLARLADGSIAAGSAPKGNIYAFPAEAPTTAAGAKPELRTPIILQENREAEVTDLLPTPDGGLYATLTFSGGTGESRITPPKPRKDLSETLVLAEPPPAERFSGRSTLVWLPANGFPETITGRSHVAFYQLARHGDLLLVTGGEEGEMLGFDIKERLSMTFAGSASSQLNGLAPIAGQPDRYLVMRNNAAGFALLDFGGRTPREAETRRIDLGAPARLGAVRFNRLRNLADTQLSVEIKTSNGSDELEGWTPWTSLKTEAGGWKGEGLRGRYVKLRLKLPADAVSAQVDKASLYNLPQNRRPQLQDFHVLSSNFGIVAMPDAPSPPIISLGALLNGKDDDKRKSSFLSSQVVPAPGQQVVLWNVTDPDGDNLLCTFSIRRDGETAWTDIVRDTRDSYAQFDISHLPDGVYFTRLIVTETDPRPVADRLKTTFETDDLVVDHTPPQILDATAKREGDTLVVTVHGRDALSLLDGIEVNFNNGAHEQTEQPVDGIRDSREETFRIELPLPRVAGATSVEVTLYDAVGNSASQRLSW